MLRLFGGEKLGCPRTPFIILLLWLTIATLCDWLKISYHFLNQSEAKPIVTFSHAFCRA